MYTLMIRLFYIFSLPLFLNTHPSFSMERKESFSFPNQIFGDAKAFENGYDIRNEFQANLKSMECAKKLYERAHELGHPTAKNDMNRLNKEMKWEKVKPWLIFLKTTKNQLFAGTILTMIYIKECKYGNLKNFYNQNAVEWLKNLEKNGHTQAEDSLCILRNLYPQKDI